jgi:hypothetical protein
MKRAVSASPESVTPLGSLALDAGSRRSVGRVGPDRLERERAYKTLVGVNHGKPVDVGLGGAAKE